MQYALGLDNGGTIIKAAIFDITGKEIAVSSCPTETITLKPGFMERDMEVMWEANCNCIREVIIKSGVPASQIVAISVAGHGKGLYTWGNDKPVRNGILSSDNRAMSYSNKWNNDGTTDALHPQLLQQILPGQPVSLLAWMKDNEPEQYNEIKWVFSAKDYIRFRLTGEAHSELTDISGSGLMDIKNKKFDKTILDTFGISEVYDKLPPLCSSFEVCGTITSEVAKLTGLETGTPVAGGMFDIDACALAMDITSPDYICAISGTWAINEFISSEPMLDKHVMNSLYAIPDYYLIEESSPTGAGNLDWILNNLMEASGLSPDKNMYDKANEVVGKILPDQSDVYYLPFLYGTNGHPSAKASFVGLISYHDFGHMLRAVYEGTVYSTNMHVEKLLSLRPLPKAIRLAGGVTKSVVWTQMFADILNLTIEIVTNANELGALGCAMTGFVSVGVYKDYKEAAKAMINISTTFYPNVDRVKIYRKKYKKYLMIMQALDDVWSALEE